jgi:hypothetical protein
MRSRLMDTLNECIREYTTQLSNGKIQKAYKGIMAFMSGLKSHMENSHDYIASALYFGYMDMTYFAFTPPNLKEKKLKIAIVYLHKECRFEAWLGGSNRKIQSEYINLMGHKNIGKYKLSRVVPGVDSIIETILVEKPDFNHPEELKKQIEGKTIDFINDITSILDDQAEK